MNAPKDGSRPLPEIETGLPDALKQELESEIRRVLEGELRDELSQDVRDRRSGFTS